jgi:pantoate--beta-alanine ligase
MPPLDQTIDAVRNRTAAWRTAGSRIALVPTMGALHAGHIALVEQAKEFAERVVVSIFVNPTQFAASEDFPSYPRNLDGDLARLGDLADSVFAPSVEEMYPSGFATSIRMGGPADGLETDFRPDFFAGVATIVAKLLLAVAPDVAMFGEKDYQQLLVVQRLVSDLGLPVEIASIPIVREEDGLALSSRNVYLSHGERAVAPQLHAAIEHAAAAIAGGELAMTAMEEAREALRRAGFDLDYLELRDAATLAPVTRQATEPMRILVAARLGRTRLIDNVPVPPG